VSASDGAVDSYVKLRINAARRNDYRNDYRTVVTPPDGAAHIARCRPFLEVIELIRRIDTANKRYALERAVGPYDLGDETLMRLQIPV